MTGYITGLFLEHSVQVHVPEPILCTMQATIPRKILYVTSIARLNNPNSISGAEMMRQLLNKFSLPAIGVINPKWTGARKSWKNIGYEDICTIPGFFKPLNNPPEDGIVIYRKLPLDSTRYSL